MDHFQKDYDFSLETTNPELQTPEIGVNPGESELTLNFKKLRYLEDHQINLLMPETRISNSNRIPIWKEMVICIHSTNSK